MKKLKFNKNIDYEKNNGKKRRKKSIGKTILNILLFLAIAGVSLFLAFALYIVISSPDFEETELFQVEPTIIYDVNGKEITRIGTKDSTIISYDDISEVMVDALIATEDSRFFQHNGVDIVRFIKASIQQLAGKDAGGASTLSMQVIKNTYTKKGTSESKSQSFLRKFRDIYMSVFKLEKNYTKEEIIEFYLNSQWFYSAESINTTGIYGIERASQYYFGKSASDLNLAEASLMAGMFQNPFLYNPYRNPEGCRNRQTKVLNYMIMHGYITEKQKEEVLSIPINSMFVEHEDDENTTVETYQPFVDYVLKEVKKDLKLDGYETSLKIYTTYDPEVQKTLESIETGQAFEFYDDVVQEGIAVTSVTDGSIVALSGGRNYTAKGLNRATDISRQPGSTAKPIFDYAMNIEHVTHSTYAMILDEPTTYSNGTKINNYDNGYKGLITMRYAIQDSRNIPALRTFKKVVKEAGLDTIADFVHSVGIDFGDDLFESASIGGFDGVSPLELSAAYATFGRGGYYIKPYSYTKVVDVVNDKEYKNSYSKEQVMKESTAYMITNILIATYGGRGPAGTQVAGKTGTTNLTTETKQKYNLPGGSIMDAWIVSYSPSYSIALWYGYDKILDNAAEEKYYLTSNTGGGGRRNMMNTLASNIHKPNQSYDIKAKVTTADIELETNPAQLCSQFTPADLCTKEIFESGYEPTETSKRFEVLDNPTNGKANFDGTTITLSWDPIKTPDAIDSSYLSNWFNENYEEHAEKYYNLRIGYNNASIGNIGYQIYLKDSNEEKYLGYTSSPTYTYKVTKGGEYTFIIKSAYSIFKANMSSGLTINTKADIDSNVDNIIDGTEVTKPTKPTNPNKPNIPNKPTTPSTIEPTTPDNNNNDDDNNDDNEITTNND